MNTKEKIAVMQHYADGGKVEVRDAFGDTRIRHIGDGIQVAGELVWDWKSNTYSIVKEPKHIWVMECGSQHGGGRVRVLLPNDEDERERYIQTLKSAGRNVLSVDEYVSI